jgi:predicted dehydrogenase
MKQGNQHGAAIPRRKFLKNSAVGIGAMISSSRLASANVLGANDRLRIGAIGTGGRMRGGLLPYFKNQSDTELVAFCDVYQPNIERTATSLGISGAKQIKDYRAVLDDKTINAVVIATPDHWHVKIATDAVAAGKDVYVEKPITHSIEEGAGIINAVESSKRVVQVGMQQRSWQHFVQGKKIVEEGTLGQLTTVRMWWYQNYPASGHSNKVAYDKLDQKAWLGSAPMQELTPAKFYWWRWYWDFGGGALTDLMCHWIDVMHWYTGTTTPMTATTIGNRYVLDWECPDTINCVLEYPKNFTATYHGTMSSSIDDGGLELRGTKATLKLDRERLVVYPETGQGFSRAGEAKHSILIESKGDGTATHIRNFLDCVKSRKMPNADIRVAVEAARAAHLGNLALKQARTIRWNAQQARVES